jgi:hypothetical protein
MVVEKRLPNVYRQHALLDEAAGPFVNLPARLVVSEYAESFDWWFALHRQNGEIIRATLPGRGRMQEPATLVRVIQDGLRAMLAM